MTTHPGKKVEAVSSVNKEKVCSIANIAWIHEKTQL